MVRGVILPKNVFIENVQLWFLHRLFFFAAVVLIILKFFYWKEFRVLVDIANIRGSLWIQPPAPDVLEKAYSNYISSGLCSNSSSFAFDYREKAAHPHGCTHSCLHGRGPCLHPSRMFVQESPSQVMLVTRTVQHIETTSSNGSKPSSFDHFTPEMTELRLSLTYGFTGPNNEMGSSMSDPHKALQRSSSCGRVQARCTYRAQRA